MSEKTVCPVVVTENSLRIQVAAGESHTIELSRYSADILRLRAWRGAEAPRERSMVVSAKPVAVADWRVENTPGGLAIEAAGLGALIGKDGTVAFRRGGRTLVSAGARRFPSNNLPNPEDRCSAEQTFALDAGDAIYGLGQYQNGVMNWRNHDVILIHGNVTVAVPFLVSTGGWGMLWDNPSHTEFHDGPDGMRLWSEVADAVDCYICAGDSMDAVIACYRRLTGADGRFTLYEDAGDSYDYEKGARSAIEFAWDNGARRLSIGRRTGGFKGMLERRKFRVVVVGSNHGVGIDPTAAADREIAYDSAAVVVDLR